MKKRLIILLIIVVPIVVAVLIVYPPFHRWARMHVNIKTAVEDHPLNCASCHLYLHKTKLNTKILNTEYLSPFNLVASQDGQKLFVVAEEGNLLLVVDIGKEKVIKKVKVGNQPHSVVLNNDETLAYVSNQWSDNVSVIDLNRFEVIDTLSTGNGPAGIALSKNGEHLYVVNSYGSDISLIDLSMREEIRRFTAGNNPTGIAANPAGNLFYVTSRRTQGLPYDDTVSCELTVADDRVQRIVERKDIKSAYMMENIAFTPSGDLLFMPMIRPKNNVPTVQVDRGWMMTNGFAVVEQKPNGRTIQLLVDEYNEYFADPFDMVITPDGKKGFISHSGVNAITVLDIEAIRKLISESSDELLQTYANHLGISSRYVLKRILTGANPKGMTLSADGRKLYVAEHLEDRIAVINTESLETEKTIDLGGPGRITVARQGRRVLNNASGTFQNQYACYTCHPDVHEDGLVYNMASIDMGRNLANTQSLRDIGDTPPYKWNGKNQTIYKQDGMRFSTVLTRNEPFAYDDLDALVAYIITDNPNPPNLLYNPTGKLNAMQLRGKALFERTHDMYGKEIPEINRCVTCHPPPYFTNLEPADVGTLAATDDSMLFDTPHLSNIYASAPYLHDGRAKTLEEIWTLYAPDDKHGAVNDFTKIQLNELIEYLKALSSPEFHMKDEDQVMHAEMGGH
ncbi:MAG: beta-propeller fold lactonase family protein [Bacteroidales bacterium]|nr:beta-propeller fold lactonase family protein [Bacteroidales bacterium]